MSPESALTPTSRDALPILYGDLDRDIAKAGPVCQLSGRCCRFEEYGHRLYISRMEADLLLEKGLPPGCDAEQAAEDKNACPFQQDKICTARERRPLGCRVYFCDPSYEGRGEELSERYLLRLKQLHQDADLQWDYKSLHAHLAEFAARAK